jgi:hypothetical protein
LILAGHSHLGALVGTHLASVPGLAEHPVHRNISVLGGDWPRVGPYWDALVGQARGRLVALIWQGNEHNALYFFEKAFRFDFKSKYISRLIFTRQIIAQSFVKKRFREISLLDLEALLSRIAAESPEKIVLVGTPPPKKDNQRLYDLLKQEPYFLEWAKQIGDEKEVAITEPIIRLKLWHVLQDLVAEIASNIGGVFIPVPDELRDAEGFLKTEYWANDVTHANEAYGEIMIRNILEKVGA